MPKKIHLVLLLLLSCWLQVCGQQIPLDIQENANETINKRAERSGLIRAVIEKGNEALIDVITLDHATEGASATMRRAIARASEQGSDLIVLHLKNPIMDIIQARLAANALREFSGPSFAFIDGELSGAPLVLALSCDKIYLAPDSTIAYAPVRLQNTDLELSLEQIRELRLITRSEFRAAAQARGHDVDLATTLADPRTPLNKGGIEHSGQSADFQLDLKQASLRSQGLPLFAEGEALSIEALLRASGLKDYQLQYSQESFSYALARQLLPFLPLLWIGIMMGLIFEFHTPGFGIGGSIGTLGLIFCLFLQYTLGLANGWDIGLIILGIGLLGVEIGILPGFGVAGISGIICFTFGIVMSFINLDGLPDNPVLRNSYIWESSLFAIKNLSFIVLGTGIFGALFMYGISKSSLYNKVVLDDIVSTKLSIDKEDEPQVQGQLAASLLLHSDGLTLTDLHPVGSAKICGIHLDVISHGEPIASNTRIIVTEIEGNRVVVEKINAD